MDKKRPMLQHPHPQWEFCTLELKLTLKFVADPHTHSLLEGLINSRSNKKLAAFTTGHPSWSLPYPILALTPALPAASPGQCLAQRLFVAMLTIASASSLSPLLTNASASSLSPVLTNAILPSLERAVRGSIDDDSKCHPSISLTVVVTTWLRSGRDLEGEVGWAQARRKKLGCDDVGKGKNITGIWQVIVLCLHCTARQPLHMLST